MAPENTVFVMNVVTQAPGLAVAVETSPYYAEEVKGIKRVKVWAEVPSSSGTVFGGWDWWLLSDTVIALMVPVADTFALAA